MKLKITPSGSVRGEKVYTVTDGCDRLFSGTLEEVKRFLVIHNSKVRQRKEAADAFVAALRGS